MWNHDVMMCIGNRVNAACDHENFDDVLWAGETMILLNKFINSLRPRDAYMRR